jgi:hypothetical protein
MEELKRRRVFEYFLILLLAFTVCFGCASTGKNTADAEEVTMTEEASPPGFLYYDFGDVPVPSELTVDKKRSFVYHIPGFTAGVLGLSGRVEVNSLIRFFEHSMPEDNWKLACSFKSPRTVLFFSKADKSCIINITEKLLKVEVEIWVAPTIDE